MKNKECYDMLMEKIKNNETLHIDLKNGVILELYYDKDINNYRGYWEDEDIYIGIWEKKTLIQILSGNISGVEIKL